MTARKYGRAKSHSRAASWAFPYLSVTLPIIRSAAPMHLRTALLLLLLNASMLRAEHLPGGSITYECLGNNTYTVTLTLFRECSGEAMIPQTLDLTNDCGVVFSLTDLQPLEVANVSPLCPAEAANSSCSGGSLIGIEVYTYQQTLFLSPCNAWTISWSTCCRQTSVNVTGNPGLYIEARLNNQGGTCNSSPAFTDQGIPFACVGQAMVYDPGAVEPDGNTYRFRFIEARYATPEPLPVSYQFPFYGLEPFTGMLVDETTGSITFTPTVQGYIVTVVQVDEYDANEQWIGSVMRDFTFLVRACSNTQPDAAAGTITSVTGTGSQDGDRSVRACANGVVCFSMAFTDPDPGQSVSIITNAAVALPGATISTSGADPLEVEICWDADSAMTGVRYFTIQALDDACPVRGMRSFTYRVTVEAPPEPIVDGEALACPQTTPFALMDSLGTYPTEPGTWTGPTGAAHSGFLLPATDPPGIYTFTVESFPGCRTSADVVVTYLPPQDTLCSLVSVSERTTREAVLYPNPTAGLLHLRGLGHTDQRTARIVDLQGRTVGRVALPGTSTETRIHLPETLANGGYLLYLEGAELPVPPLRFTLQR
jgi:hypothetical protein